MPHRIKDSLEALFEAIHSHTNASILTIHSQIYKYCKRKSQTKSQTSKFDNKRCNHFISFKLYQDLFSCQNSSINNNKNIYMVQSGKLGKLGKQGSLIFYSAVIYMKWRPINLYCIHTYLVFIKRYTIKSTAHNCHNIQTINT